MEQISRNLRAVILDVDGVIWVSGALALGATELLTWLRRQCIPFCLLTNGCNAAQTIRYATLVDAGLPLSADQLVTPADATKEWLAESAAHSIMYLGAPGVLSDLSSDITFKESGPVDAVVVGDVFDHYDRHALDRAAKAVIAGAQLVAMQRNRRWFDGKEWYIDNGFWIAGLEYVTGSKAVVTGKPSPVAYLTAIKRLGPSLDPSNVVLVSDDIEVDLKGGKAVGLTTIYFGTSPQAAAWVDFRAEDSAALRSLLRERYHG